MSDIPSAPDPGSERPPPRTPPPPAGHKRWTLKTMLAPLVLAVLGLALSLAAWRLYPDTSEHPTPIYSSLYVTAKFPITDVSYSVTRASPAISRVEVQVYSPANPPAGKRANVLLSLPPGTFFEDCLASSACRVFPGHPSVAFWVRPLSFRYDPRTGWTATVDFPVKAGMFGMTFNDVEASASIPKITYYGPGKPFIYVYYPIPLAADYDWSSFPVAVAGSSGAKWEEPLAHGETPARVAVGVNHTAQADDDNKIFIAGALIALAGAAILTAVIEGLHVRDWETLRTPRSE
jgi:hypothetical protein